MLFKELSVKSEARGQLIDITPEVRDFIQGIRVNEGICTIFVPHTTAGVTINENADPHVCSDILNQLDKMVPWHNSYKHFEGNSAAHIKAAMMGFSQIVLIKGGELLLGTWQGIYFCEFDGPRTRKVHLKVTEG